MVCHRKITGSVILSGVMMLEHLGWNEAANSILKGLETAINNKTVTCDFARQMEGAKKIKCSEFADEIIKHLGITLPCAQQRRELGLYCA